MVLKEGSYVSLNTISATEREQIEESLKNTEHLLGTKSYFFHYEKGICHTDDSCVPFLLKRKNNRKHNDYRLEIVTTHKSNNTPHVFLRIKNPTGECYSFTKYLTPSDDKCCCCKEKRQHCYPPIYEFMGLEEQQMKTTKVRLTQSEYNAILEALEKEKELTSYHLLNDNCTTWIKRVCSAADIEVDSSTGTTLFIAFPSFGKKWRKWCKSSRNLSTIEKNINYVERFCTAFFSLFFGNSFTNAWEWMIQNGKIENPWILRQCWQEEIVEWQEKEKQKNLAEKTSCDDPLSLKKLDEKQEHRKYGYYQILES